MTLATILTICILFSAASGDLISSRWSAVSAWARPQDSRLLRLRRQTRLYLVRALLRVRKPLQLAGNDGPSVSFRLKSPAINPNKSREAQAAL